MDARLPDSIGRFKVFSLLGRGAMGVVYKGHDPDLDREVAIKIIRADLLAGAERASYIGRFADEAKLAARCRHANIAGIYEFAWANDQPHLIMEYVDGIPLRRAVPQGTQLSLPELRHIALQILDALDHAHEAGVAHCDVKPNNILLTRAARVKITDFGISRMLGGASASVPLMIGTPSYMSPEQCLGEAVDHRSDVFSLGAVLYEMLTGERPFQGLAYTDTVFKLINQPHHAVTALRPDLPPAMGEIIDRALAKKAADRFLDVAAFAEALTQIEADEETPAVVFQRTGPKSFAMPDLRLGLVLTEEGAGDAGTVRLAPALADLPAVVMTLPPLAEITLSPAALSPLPRHRAAARKAPLARFARWIRLHWPRPVMNRLAPVIDPPPQQRED